MPRSNRGRKGGRQGGREGGERWLSQVADKCLYCSNAGARQRDVNEKGREEVLSEAAGVVRDDVTSLCNLIFYSTGVSVRCHSYADAPCSYCGYDNIIPSPT